MKYCFCPYIMGVHETYTDTEAGLIYKRGKIFPGTGHCIVDYQKLGARKIKNEISMNPNYREENVKHLHEADIELSFVEH